MIAKVFKNEKKELETILETSGAEKSKSNFGALSGGPKKPYYPGSWE